MHALGLLRRPDFRRLYIAVAVSELGDAFHYIALMWFALTAGGPLGVMAVRLADSVPALVFGFHGGVAADRWNRTRVMIAADFARGAILIPVAVTGLTGTLPLSGLVVAAFLLQTATAYFTPAYGSLLPALVDRRNAQEANGLVKATVNALSIGGWAAAAGLLALVPISTFFALNAVSFLFSALFIARIRHTSSTTPLAANAPHWRETIAALQPLPGLTVSIAVLGLALTVSAGVWIAGIPELVRTTLHRDAGGFSLVMVGYALGSVAAGAVLARFPVRDKIRASLLAWLLYLPAYEAFAMTTTLEIAIAAALITGVSHSAVSILVSSAAQEQATDKVLGRVMKVIALVDRGAHATGLLLVSPLFAVVAPTTMFAAAALVIPLFGVAGALATLRLERRATSHR